MHVTRAALKAFRREGFGNLVMDARIPNGRIGAGGEGSAELGVDLPGRDTRRAVAAQSPETLTPDGPATLYSDWHGGMTDEGEHPELLTGFRVVVQPGGRAGTIRFLVYEFPAY